MKRRLNLTAAAGFILLLILPLTVLASDITAAKYVGRVSVINSSSATTSLSVPFALSTVNTIAAKMLNAAATDAAIRTGSTDMAFMPGIGANPWIMYVPSLGNNEQVYYNLYSGGATGGKLMYFPGNAGMTTLDSPSLELGNNFEIEQKVMVNNSAGADKYFFQKQGAFQSYINSTGTTMTSEIIVYAPYQNISNNAISFGVWSRIAQKFAAFPISTIREFKAWFVNSTGAPIDVTCNIRKVADSSIIGSMGIQSVPGTGVSTELTFSTPVFNSAVQDIYISLEAAGVSYVLYQSPDAGDGNLAAFNGAWTDFAGQDLRYSLTAVCTVSAPITSTEDIVITAADATDLKLIINGVTVGTEVLNGASVPDNINNIVSFQNGAATYVEYQKITVAGVLQQDVSWENALTFTDASGNGHDVTPSFRTTSSDADVSASLLSFTAVNQDNVPGTGSSDESWELVTSTPTEPTHLYTELNMTFMGAGMLQSFSTATDTPLAIPVFSWCFGWSLFLGLIVYRVSMGRFKNNLGEGRRGSLFAMAVTSCLVMLYFVIAGGGVIPGWVLIPYCIEAIAAIMWRQNPYGLGG